VKLHTIQLLSVWRRAQGAGYLVGGNGPQFDETYGWREAYEWMRKQMLRRIPNFSVDYPVWAWVERPDLRRRDHLSLGVKGVLLTVEVPKERVLVSDFSAWHFVLGKWYLPMDGERERLHRTWDITSGAERARRVRSWERIFTPERIRDSVGRGPLQACVDRVYTEEVIEVRHFLGRRSWLDNLSTKPKRHAN